MSQSVFKDNPLLRVTAYPAFGYPDAPGAVEVKFSLFLPTGEESLLFVLGRETAQGLTRDLVAALAGDLSVRGWMKSDEEVRAALRRDVEQTLLEWGKA